MSKRSDTNLGKGKPELTFVFSADDCFCADTPSGENENISIKTMTAINILFIEPLFPFIDFSCCWVQSQRGQLGSGGKLIFLNSLHSPSTIKRDPERDLPKPTISLITSVA